MTAASEIADLFARDLARLLQEIEAFPDTDTLWRVVPGVTNPAGTLALHLEGNLRDFVGRHLGGIDYTRDRKHEFGTRGVSREELLARIAPLPDMVPTIVAALTDTGLEKEFPQVVLGKPVSTRQFLVHLQGHLNYHLGQIDYLRRTLTGQGAIALKGL